MGQRIGAKRSALGQVWTPAWVARLMAGWALANGAETLWDPAAGQGAFFTAVAEMGLRPRCRGMEIDPETAAVYGPLPNLDVRIEVGDFLREGCVPPGAAIAANPPFVRHHAMAPETKAIAAGWRDKVFGPGTDGRSGLHTAFLAKCLDGLEPGRRAAFLLPGDVFDGVSAQRIWRAVGRRYRIEGVLTFAGAARVFPSLDLDVAVVFLQAGTASQEFGWGRVETPEEAGAWIAAGFPKAEGHAGLHAVRRSFEEAVETGFLRPPRPPRQGCRLGSFVRVMRGIVAPDLGFFVSTAKAWAEAEIPIEALKRVVTRTKDIPSEGPLDADTLDRLDARGRPTWLLSPPPMRLPLQSDQIRRRLAEGEAAGVHRRPSAVARRPWWRAEDRPAPPWFFLGVGRKRRFVPNLSPAAPMSTMQCVYSHRTDAEFQDALSRLFERLEQDDRMQEIGRSYGGGYVKVEPGALESLVLSEADLAETGLAAFAAPRARRLFGARP